MIAKIDLQECMGCGICVTRCPAGAVSWASPDQMLPQLDSDLCTGCGECVERCPAGAIDLPGYTPTTIREPAASSTAADAPRAGTPRRETRVRQGHEDPARFRVSPLWWPALAAASPVVAPWLAMKARRFAAGQREAARRNEERIASARSLDLPALKSMKITVVVEQEHETGFTGDAAVSYLIQSERGSVLMDIGFGAEHPAFMNNTNRLDLTMADVDALVVSHLHLDHMGGLAAQRSRWISLPPGFAVPAHKPCFVPDECEADGLAVRRIDGPRLLEAGLATTGPLARMLFFFGLMEEQVIVARLEGKGLVVLTGCGHPTIGVILRMVRRLSDEPLYAVGGGLHLPITRSRGRRMGIELQQIFGTGKPVWSRIDDGELLSTIRELNRAAPRRLYLSAHDSCAYALERLASEVDADVEVFRAGATYEL